MQFTSSLFAVMLIVGILTWVVLLLVSKSLGLAMIRPAYFNLESDDSVHMKSGLDDMTDPVVLATKYGIDSHLK